MVSGFRHGADSLEFRRDDRGRIIGTTFPDGSTCTYDPETFAVAAFKPLWLVPGLAEALGLWDIAEPLLQFGPDAAAGFDKPSNPAFQPDEYRSTNCCLPCLPGVYLGCGCQLLETLLVVCGCLPAEPEPPVLRKGPNLCAVQPAGRHGDV